jgi:hypothetical protein
MEYLVGAFHETFPQDSPPFLKKGKELWLDIVTWQLKAGMVEPEQTSIAEQRLGNHVPSTTNSNERVVER